MISRKRRRHWNRQLKRNPQSTRGIYSTLKLMDKLKQGRRYRGKLKLEELFKVIYKIKRERENSLNNS